MKMYFEENGSIVPFNKVLAIMIHEREKYSSRIQEKEKYNVIYGSGDVDYLEMGDNQQLETYKRWLMMMGSPKILVPKGDLP